MLAWQVMRGAAVDADVDRPVRGLVRATNGNE
jgi:hypothetical protein